MQDHSVISRKKNKKISAGKLGQTRLYYIVGSKSANYNNKSVLNCSLHRDCKGETTYSVTIVECHKLGRDKNCRGIKIVHNKIMI